MSLSQYDNVNVSLYNKGKSNKYLCSMCGQYTTLSDSASHKGYNLVCNKCIYKMVRTLGSTAGEIIQLIQRKGKVLEED